MAAWINAKKTWRMVRGDRRSGINSQEKHVGRCIFFLKTRQGEEAVFASMWLEISRNQETHLGLKEEKYATGNRRHWSNREGWSITN